MSSRILVFFFLQLSWLVVNAQTAEKDSVETEVKQLIDQGGAMINRRQLDSALVLLKYTLDYTKRELGEDHLLAGDIAHTLGYVRMVQEQQDEAKSYYLEALRIRRINYLPPNASLAVTLNGLGLMYEYEGEYALAEAHYIDARTNWEGAFGRDYYRCSWAQHNLGKLYNRIGRDQEGVECLTEALRVKQANLSVDDPDIGQTLVVLSGAYYQLGDFAGYEATALRASEIWKKQKGANDLLYYWSRHNLALLQERLGNYEMATSLAKEALAGKITIYGPYHQDVASTLTLLSAIFGGTLQYDSANYYLQQAKGIYEMQQQYSLEYAWVLNNLGLNACYQGNYDQAFDYLGSALELKKSLIGIESTDYSSTLLNYTRTLIYKNQLDTAMLLLEQQKLFYEQRDITRNENYITCLDLLSLVQIKLSEPETAFHTTQLINHHYRESIPIISGYTSENELFAYLQTAEYYLDKYLSLAFHSPHLNDVDRNDISDQVLFFKGFLLDKYIEIRNQVQWDCGSLRLYHDLNVQKKLLAKQLVKLPAERQDTKSIEDEIGSLERALSQKVTLPNVHAGETAKIRKVLKSDEVALEFVEYKYFMPDFKDSTYYSAILIHPSLASPVLIPLFESRKLAQYVTDTLRNRSDYANQLYTKDGHSLYDLIWAPIAPYLQDVKTIYFSSSGLLHLINLNAIPTAGNKILADEYDLVQLITTSQLLLTNDPFSTTPECTLMGGINYEFDTTQYNSNTINESVMVQEGFTINDLPEPDPILRGKVWTYLKGSDAEIDQIFPLFGEAGLEAIAWKGYAATEEQFKNLSRSKDRPNSPRIIHLSTHGYFYPNLYEPTTTALPGNLQHTIKSADNPLIRSGLILAGGNYAWQKGEPFRPWMEDGILTAYEIVPMDLSNTELVVLSACESGLGDIDGNEGVYGLQRAFKIAGVRYIIMSLWQVPDAATVELMTRFYTHLLKHHQPVRTSLLQAQKEMRTDGYDPYEWAGFVLIE
ncbi:MAG: CHAT domain-containing protein [Saprospiraceae bacterium]|nr:CHAT domain-containing protein [Candidatus Opimibacter skivensis]